MFETLKSAICVNIIVQDEARGKTVLLCRFICLTASEYVCVMMTPAAFYLVLSWSNFSLSSNNHKSVAGEGTQSQDEELGFRKHSHSNWFVLYSAYLSPHLFLNASHWVLNWLHKQCDLNIFKFFWLVSTGHHASETITASKCFLCLWYLAWCPGFSPNKNTCPSDH